MIGICHGILIQEIRMKKKLLQRGALTRHVCMHTCVHKSSVMHRRLSVWDQLAAGFYNLAQILHIHFNTLTITYKLIHSHIQNATLHICMHIFVSVTHYAYHSPKAHVYCLLMRFQASTHQMYADPCASVIDMTHQFCAAASGGQMWRMRVMVKNCDNC